MIYLRGFFLCIFLIFTLFGQAQINEAYDDFEGNTNIPAWEEDDCQGDTNFSNPFQEGDNLSAAVLRYEDTGGMYANLRFQMNDNFDLSQNHTFSLQVYIPSDGLTGNQVNQISVKLQNGDLAAPWSTQCEIIKTVGLDEWQTLTFDFAHDDFRNFDSSSTPPILRSDFNRVLLQVNGENNNDRVLAYFDNILLFESEDPEPIFTKLVWSDEFDNDGALDSDKWFHQTKIPQGNSWFNNEIQHYTNKVDNSFVEDGILKIVAKKESFTDQGTTKQFTSARLNSKFAFTYGRAEIRAKLPTGIGTWPAIWMLGKNITENGAYWQTQGFGTTGWPACGEIDIMEHWGDNQDHVSSAIHTPSSFGGTINSGGRYLDNASEEFHVYSMVWTEDKIAFAVDGIIHYIYKPPVQNAENWPFDLEQFFLLNVAVLPIIDPNFTESAMEIDYVRVYQKADSNNIEETDLSTTFIYPNPFSHEINIALESPSDKTIDISLINSKGMIVRTDQVKVKDGSLKLERLGNLPEGVYFIQFVKDELTYCFKAIKI